jgi:uncharacterized protein YndB with AHSA1/START domain
MGKQSFITPGHPYLMSPETCTIHQKVMIPAHPDVVYDMLMDPVLQTKFTGYAVEGSNVVGGTMTAGSGHIRIRNLELERGRLIVQEWSTRNWPDGFPPSRLEIIIRPIGQGTEIRVVHSELPCAMAESIDHAWYDHYWNPLFEHLHNRALY